MANISTKLFKLSDKILQNKYACTRNIPVSQAIYTYSNKSKLLVKPFIYIHLTN